MLLDCLTHINNRLPEIFMNSGRNLFRYGNYHGCLETEGMDYFQIALTQSGILIPFGSVGVCLPDHCTTA